MSERDYKTAILDVSFISSLHRVDNSCGDLLYAVKDCYSDNCAIVHKEYYHPRQPCHEVQHRCDSDSDPNFITRKEAKKYLLGNAHQLIKVWPNLKKHIDDPGGVHPDIMMLAIADKYNESIVLSCDGPLLKACYLKHIAHLCLKAALVECDNLFGMGSIFGDARYNVQDMLNSMCNHWSLDFSNSKECKDCKSKICHFETYGKSYAKKFHV